MSGTPVVSTSIGVEGLGLIHESDALVGDTPDEFARHLQRLVNDSALWERLSSIAKNNIWRRHSDSVARSRLLAALASIVPPAASSAT
jgi:glycosyltransferase involved in cell wall biosynthesis